MGVELPPGLLDPSGAVWVTEGPLGDAGRLWADLAELYPVTGWWPVVLVDGWSPVAGGRAGRPAEDSARDERTPGDVLGGSWEAAVRGRSVEDLRPFSEGFPGLAAPGVPDPVPGVPDPVPGAPDPAVAEPPGWAGFEGRLALVAVDRPAAVGTVLGWDGAAPLVATADVVVVVESWEDRFCARPIALGADTLSLVVGRPPRGGVASARVAAELFALCPDLVWTGTDTLGGLAEQIDSSPVWELRWGSG